MLHLHGRFSFNLATQRGLTTVAWLGINRTTEKGPGGVLWAEHCYLRGWYGH